MYTKVKNTKELSSIRRSGQITGQLLEFALRSLSEGMTSYDLARLIELEMKKHKCQPAFLNYQGFPDIVCISVNQEVVHGIPNRKYSFKEGDLVSVDFGVSVDGMITDAARTAIIGSPDDEMTDELVKVTLSALNSGIDAVSDGCRVGDISEAVESRINQKKYGIVRDLVGHGVGHSLHEEPNIPNYGSKGSGPVLKSGMTIAIEPMVTLGSDQILIKSDGWTVITADNSLSAHFEDTILVTPAGAEILTRPQA
jgi:methionyl aminopeptidase